MTEEKNKIKAHLGNRIRTERVRRGMYLKELERQSGVSLSTLCRIERSARPVKLADFVAVCVVLGVNPVLLLCGSEVWNPKEVSL
jgi:transcriptional regulator with XRE-family HTH domain